MVSILEYDKDFEEKSCGKRNTKPDARKERGLDLQRESLKLAVHTMFRNRTFWHVCRKSWIFH